MSTVVTQTAKKQRTRTFSITFTIEGTDYRVSPLPCDPEIGTKAFRFAKQGGDGEVYDLYADPVHGLTCQCKGFLRWGHCKHVQTIQAAGKVFDLTPAEVPVEQGEACPF